MVSLSRTTLAIALLGALGSGCAMQHGLGADGGDRSDVWVDSHDGGPIHTCAGSLPEGAACVFTEPCMRISDYWMGRCGTETWSCVDGRVVYTDARFACALDAGMPTVWCDGYVAPPAATTNDCRTSSDCASVGGTCWAPGDTGGLHGGGACPMTCLTDPDCADGNVCETFNGGICSQCIPTCTETSCGLWEACGDDGHCRPAQCATDGYLCAPGSRCGPIGDELVDPHGCTVAACTSDADCGCGACVEGACALGPGRCDLPRP